MTEALDLTYRTALYAALSPENPAGQALHDSDFFGLAEKAEWPRDEIGNRPDPMNRPNFNALRAEALGFLEKRTRDVRPLTALVLAETGLNGPIGLAKAVDLAAHWLTTHWESVHPQDLEGDGDYFDRMEVLLEAFSPVLIAAALDTAPLCEIRGIGPISLRSLKIAAGRIEAREGEFNLPADALEKAFAQNPAASVALAQAPEALDHAAGRLAALGDSLQARESVFNVEGFQNSVIDKLRAVCAQAKAELAPYLTAQVPVDDAQPATGQDASSAPVVTARPAASAALQSRADAMTLMDSVIRFYATEARSSPIPLALIALRDLMDQDFNQWFEQTARNGLARAALDISKIEQGRLDAFMAGADPSTSVDADALADIAARIDAALAELGDGPPSAPKEDAAEGKALIWTPPAALAQLRQAADDLQAMLGGREDEAEKPAAGPGIRDRAAVRGALEQIAVFFQHAEPSSPAPVYLRQMRALVEADFKTILLALTDEDEGPRLKFQ